MFGAPDIPRPATPAPRRPRIGDHVNFLGGYLGLIVDVLPDGMAVYARRHAPGWKGVVEDTMPLDRLQITPVVPIGFDEVFDDGWRRGKLG